MCDVYGGKNRLKSLTLCFLYTKKQPNYQVQKITNSARMLQKNLFKNMQHCQQKKLR